MDILEKKKTMFRDGIMHANDAKNVLWELQVQPELRTTLTNEQNEALREFKAAFRNLLSVYKDLESGRSR